MKKPSPNPAQDPTTAINLKAKPSDEMPAPDTFTVLTERAIDPVFAAGIGVREATTVEALPEYARYIGEGALPALVVPWRSLDGTLVEQVRPANPVMDGAEQAKYLWPKGQPPIANVLRHVENPSRVIVVEGTFQTIAALQYAPPAWQIVGIGGCSNWSSDGIANGDFMTLCEGRDVVLLFDADRASNVDVWTAATKLAEALDMYGAASVRYASTPGRGTAGLDDALAGVPESKRRSLLSNIVNRADPKPGAKPKPTRKAERHDWLALGKSPRPVLNVKDDRLSLGQRISDAMRGRWDSTRLFTFGDAKGLVSVEDGVLVEIDRDGFVHLVNQATDPRVAVAGVGLEPSTYDPTTIAIARDMTARTFTQLEGVRRAPFVRPDGTVCTTPGYDCETRLLLIASPGLEGVTVPEHPTDEDLAAAVNYLLEEWLGDFPFHEQADRANALVLVLTPFIRPLVRVVPLAVLDGAHAGVGKGKLAAVITLLALGREVDPTTLPDSKTEAMKAIHSMARDGREVVLLDESHTIQGDALALGLTAAAISSRVLGESHDGSYPNRMTWIAAGNRVRVLGDLFRRVYPIRLYPTRQDHQDRNDFRHPNIERWTETHRAELMSAALTLVRAWFDRGCPEPESSSFALGSFEEWQLTIGGILDVAGVPGFLGNVSDFRNEVADDRQAWARHLRDLRGKYGAGAFTTAQVRSDVAQDEYADPLGWDGDAPDPVTDRKAYMSRLGNVYRSKRDVPTGALVLRRLDEEAHGGRRKWLVEDLSGESGEPGEPGHDARHGETPSSGHAVHTRVGVEDASPDSPESPRDDLVNEPDPARSRSAPTVFDLETGSVDDLWTAGPSYVRLVGSPGQIDTDPSRLIRHVDAGGTLVAHNGLGFDYLALARHHGLDLLRHGDAGRLLDTKVLAMLADPPPYGMKAGQVAVYYSLSNVASRLGVPGKTDNLKVLAREFGGYDRIPTDDPRYRDYLAGDVAATRAVLERLPVSDYARREHRILSRLAVGVTLAGFRVDERLVAQRLAEGAGATEQGLATLRAYGLPTTRKDGTPAQALHMAQAGRAAIAEAFASFGVPLPPTKGGAPALDKNTMLALAKHDNDEVRELAETVLALNGVRSVYGTIERYLVRGRVHPQVDARQASGRLSITKPGLTVMGKRNGRWVEREVFLPEPGHVILACDMSQIDARAIAALSQDPAYMALFEPGVDAHEEVADRVWGVRDGPDGEYRNRAKAIAHGWNYGMGITGLARQAGVTLEVAEQFDATMRERFPRLVEWRDEVREQARGGDLLDNGWGRLMRADPERAHTQAPALMGQGCARDLMMDVVLRLPLEVVPMIRAIVHDEILLSVPKDQANDIKTTVLEAMSFEWRDVPIIGKAEHLGQNWGDVYRKR